MNFNTELVGMAPLRWHDREKRASTRAGHLRAPQNKTPGPMATGLR